MHSSNGGLHSEAHPKPMDPRAMSGSTVFCFWRLAMCQAGRLAFFKAPALCPSWPCAQVVRFCAQGFEVVMYGDSEVERLQSTAFG